MPTDNVKEQLILATIKLLSESGTPVKITARQIASEAGVNLAMINYYFKSKDELINTAVGKIIEARSYTLRDIMVKEIPAKQKLMEFLISMSDIVMEYYDITRASVPYVLLEGDFNSSYFILPVIRECYGNKKTETECRMASYLLISSLQLMLYRNEDYFKFSGIDAKDKQKRDEALQMLVDLIIQDRY